MSYDPRAVKIKKAEKAIAILSFNKEIEKHYIREAVKSAEKQMRVKSQRNKGDKSD